MIKFFRNIRQNLIMENPPNGKSRASKTGNPAFAKASAGRYLKYAIGEIVLVMIGILLALQVNNWNENRKNNLAFEKLIVSFNKELKSNIEKSNLIIRRNYHMDSIIQLISGHKLDRKMIEENPIILHMISFYVSTIYYSEENLNLLLNQKEDFPTKYEPIIEDLQLLKEFIDSQQKWEQRLLDFVNEMDRYNNQNFEWLNKTDSVSISHKIDYLLNNPYYHNNLQSFIILQLDENVFDMNNVRLVSLMILKEIEDLQNAPNHQDAEEFIRSLGFNTLPKFDCNDSIAPLVYKASFRMNLDVYNATQDSVTLQSINENGEKFNTQLRIPPGKISFLNRFRPEGTIFIHEKEGACVAKYQNKRNSILVIQ